MPVEYKSVANLTGFTVIDNYSNKHKHSHSFNEFKKLVTYRYKVMIESL